jgi:hypothetical protein
MPVNSFCTLLVYEYLLIRYTIKENTPYVEEV